MATQRNRFSNFGPMNFETFRWRESRSSRLFLGLASMSILIDSSPFTWGRGNGSSNAGRAHFRIEFDWMESTAVHRLGSLDNAVQQLRRRNLAMSFSILALLTASVAIVLVSTARAQRLANRQMEFVWP